MDNHTNSLINPGQPAADFSLPDQDGRIHRLADYQGSWLVLYFYPKDDTPGCTKEACQFRDDNAQFVQRHAKMLGVSPDNEKSHTKFIDKFDLNFPLLADHDANLCQEYGVWQQKSMFGKKYMGVVRTTYIINPEGKIAHRFDKVKVTDHIKKILKK